METISPATYRLEEVQRLMGISRTVMYESVRDGTFPVKPVRFKRLYLFPRTEIDTLLRIPGRDAASPDSGALVPAARGQS